MVPSLVMVVLLAGASACSIDSASDGAVSAEQGVVSVEQGALAFVDELGDGEIADGTSADAGSAANNDAPAGGRSCEADAYPGDTEFRELACQVQWTQLDLLAERAPMDPAWLDRETAALALYTLDRQLAITELRSLLAEMNASDASGSGLATAPEVAPGTSLTAGLEDCVIEIAQLMLEASGEGAPNPADSAQWQASALEIEAIANSGDLAGAEAAACDLRDLIESSVQR